MCEYSWDGTLNKLKYLLQINGWILERNIENGKSQQIIYIHSSKKIDNDDRRDLQSNIKL